MIRTAHLLLAGLLLAGPSCQSPTDKAAPAATGANPNAAPALAAYHDPAGRHPDDQLSGGVRMIPITTPQGNFRVWTKRVGHSPGMKVLLLHGGPGMTHEAYEAFDSFLPQQGIEYYYYDQLGSGNSDQPKDPRLWSLPRFVEEVEQVRRALKLDSSNFYLFGHSWGGILAQQYALKYQRHLKGLIISNMVPSMPDYNRYAHEVLGPKLKPEVLKEILAFEAKKDYGNPRYMQLIEANYYPEHVLRMPSDKWPEPVQRSFKHLNQQVYVTMQGQSEFGTSQGANLSTWDVKARLPELKVPTLAIGAEHDTMDPAQMKYLAEHVQHGRYHYCPNGSHMALYDDQQTYFQGLTQFILDVNQGTFPAAK